MPGPADRPMVWSHVGLNCVDQKTTEDFYTRYFGFSRARVVDLGESRIVFLRKGDAYLELFAAGTEPAGTAPGETGRRPRDGCATWRSRPTAWTRSWPSWATRRK